MLATVSVCPKPIGQRGMRWSHCVLLKGKMYQKWEIHDMIGSLWQAIMMIGKLSHLPAEKNDLVKKWCHLSYYSPAATLCILKAIALCFPIEFHSGSIVSFTQEKFN